MSKPIDYCLSSAIFSQAEQEAANQAAIVNDTCQIVLDKHKTEDEILLGAWALIDVTTASGSNCRFDTVLIVTTTTCYIVRLLEAQATNVVVNHSTRDHAKIIPLIL